MATYKDIQREIDKLQKLAASARKAEVKSVIAGIRKQIAEHGLTAEELGLAEGSAPKTRSKVTSTASKLPKSVGAPKYQDPKSKKTWTGRGKPPNWIVNAKNRDAFLIKAVAASPEVATPLAVKPASKAVKGAKGSQSQNRRAQECKGQHSGRRAGRLTGSGGWLGWRESAEPASRRSGLHDRYLTPPRCETR